MITDIERLEVAEEAIGIAKGHIKNAVEVKIETNMSANAALLRIDSDGTEHYSPTGEVIFTLKIRTMNYKPLCQDE